MLKTFIRSFSAWMSDSPKLSEATFVAALDANPEDWDTRVRYADWLDVSGRKYEAIAQRLMAHDKQCPFLLWAGERWDGGTSQWHELRKFSDAQRWNSVVDAARHAFCRSLCRSSRASADALVAESIQYLHEDVLMQPPLE